MDHGVLFAEISCIVKSKASLIPLKHFRSSIVSHVANLARLAAITCGLEGRIPAVSHIPPSSLGPLYTSTLN